MEQNKPESRVSVRSLVEFILREGDIDLRRGAGMDVDAMQAGARMHRKVQSRSGSGYEAEVPLKLTLDLECASLTVEGRADGIFKGTFPVRQMPDAVRERAERRKKDKRALVAVDEIKCMYRNVMEWEQPETLHLAQAKCYAYMYARQEKLDEIFVQMTYVDLDTEAIRRFWSVYSFEELEQWFFGVIFSYSQFLAFSVEHFEKVCESAGKATFPFDYRKGQRELASVIYSSMYRSERLFCQAPTGVGKTISAVFPAVKAIGAGLAQKLFYLTAKTITRTAAQESFALLRSQGLCLSAVTLYAKDKLCILEERNCNPQACERACGHYDRVNACLYELLTQEETIDRECIEEYAASYRVCPYELSLDAALFVDAVICDYNYLFDPKVQLKRFFSQQAPKGDYLFLIDEAHNLVDRGRSMYSAVLDKQKVLDVKKALQPVSRRAAYAVDRIRQELLRLRQECTPEETYHRLAECDAISVLLLRFVAEMEKLLEERREFEGYDEVMEFYFDVHHFLNMYETMDDGYVIYVQPLQKKGVQLRLFCVNPGHRLKEVLKKGRSSVFFSATLLPITYYKELLTGEEQDKAVYIPSPFPTKNRFLAIADGVTSKYTSRSRRQYEAIVEYLQAAVVKPGNYMVFFPSYQMLQDVYEVACEIGFCEGKRIQCQDSRMSEEERECFLQAFQEDSKEPLVAFCILGGIFSEGIDLKEEQLIGAFIVGTGLPQVCVERDVLREYFAEHEMDGFAYAYLYPGMNKVLQAAGRVIRTEQDRGVILLLDERFLKSTYRDLFPREWSDISRVTKATVTEQIRQFWESENAENRENPEN